MLNGNKFDYLQNIFYFYYFFTYFIKIMGKSKTYNKYNILRSFGQIITQSRTSNYVRYGVWFI